MNRVVVEHLAKHYKLYRSPRERLCSVLFQTVKGIAFPALRDISFTVPEGAFVGIVGRNGAGKSTLLKILAGISQPTSGRCLITGRRAALLELGGGFNPAFTGIQNILFVTHDTGAVIRFCSEAIWLDQGSIREIGNPDTVVRNYLAFTNQEGADNPINRANMAVDHGTTSHDIAPTDLPWSPVDACESFGTRGAVVQRVALCHAGTFRTADGLLGTESLDLHIDYVATRDIMHPIFGFTVKDRLRTVILEANTDVYRLPVRPLSANERRHVRFRFSLPSLRNGEFTVSDTVAEGDQSRHIQHHWVHDALTLIIANPNLARALGGLVYADDLSYSEDSL